MIKIYGWVRAIRNHGKKVFIDLIRNNIITQIVFNESINIPLESVLEVEGIKKNRENHQINKNIQNGSWEIEVVNYKILSKSNILPYHVNDNIHEDLAQKYRTLFLRGERGQKNIRFRSKLISFIRHFMEKEDFLEIHTPILTTSSPEGARDFLVLSRLHKGHFYALPQAPQLFKQMLMISDFNKYYQIAPCFRDEDARSDRLIGDFYQLDLELAFIKKQDIFNLLIKLFTSIFDYFLQTTFKLYQFTYNEAINKYGTDKPDLRIPEIIIDYTEYFQSKKLSIFKSNDKIYGVKTDRIDDNWIKKIKVDFLFSYLYKKDGIIKGPLSKFCTDIDLQNNEIIFFINDLKKIGELRKLLPPKDLWAMVIIEEFPLFEINDGKLEFSHNPFSKPLGEINEYTLCDQYDFVLNGYEILSGAIRNDNLKSLQEAFSITGQDFSSTFPAFHKAFSYGVPPHGGAAVGIERLIMILLNEENVRSVVIVPYNTKGYDLWNESPKKIDKKYLEDTYGITYK